MPATTLPYNAKELFIGLSKVLTGVARAEPVPVMENDAITQSYFDLAQQTDPATFTQLLMLYESRQDEPAETLEHILLNQSGPQVRYLARSIMLAWYLGSWYTPQDLAQPPGSGTLSSVPIDHPSSVPHADYAVWRLALNQPVPHISNNHPAFY